MSQVLLLREREIIYNLHALCFFSSPTYLALTINRRAVLPGEVERDRGGWSCPSQRGKSEDPTGDILFTFMNLGQKLGMCWQLQWHFIGYKCLQLYFRLWSSSTRIGSTGTRKLMGLETIEDPTLKMFCHAGFLSFWFLKCTRYLLLDLRVLRYNFTCPFQYDIDRGIFWLCQQLPMCLFLILRASRAPV